jgi:glycine cleavage system pyridoxal-binding protein P
MRSYVPNTPEERLDMLKAIGLKSMEELFRGYNGKSAAK